MSNPAFMNFDGQHKRNYNRNYHNADGNTNTNVTNFPTFQAMLMQQTNTLITIGIIAFVGAAIYIGSKK